MQVVPSFNKTRLERARILRHRIMGRWGWQFHFRLVKGNGLVYDGTCRYFKICTGCSSETGATINCFEQPGYWNKKLPGCRTGLWYQVVNKTAGTLAGNYLETSGSAMFVYALKTASDSGWINSATYLPVAQSGWAGVQTKINNYTDGKPRINDFAPAMSVQNTEALYTQASLQPVDCPVSTGTQHPHGYAAVLMAASVMEFPACHFTSKIYKFYR